MRLVGTLKEEAQAFTFSRFLKSQGIDSRYDRRNGDEILYEIWVEDEDAVDEALSYFQAFEQNPEDPRFQVAAKPFGGEEKKMPLAGRALLKPRTAIRRKGHPITTLIILICTLFYLWNGVEQAKLAKENSFVKLFGFTPLALNMLYDYPPSLEKLNAFMQENPLESEEDVKNLTEQQKEALEKLQKLPYWKGLYDVLLTWPKDGSAFDARMFVKIRQGEIYRLFSPSLMHLTFLHILFNMLWLFLLGRMVEERLNIWRYLSLMLVIGIISNTAQYLMGGPFFLGYSGVIAGLGGFIWVRQKIAPWEGYPLNRGTLIFLAIFILAMLLLQIVAFFLQKFEIVDLPLIIANTAHIVGALMGMLLAKMNFLAKATR